MSRNLPFSCQDQQVIVSVESAQFIGARSYMGCPKSCSFISTWYYCHHRLCDIWLIHHFIYHNITSNYINMIWCFWLMVCESVGTGCYFRMWSIHTIIKYLIKMGIAGDSAFKPWFPVIIQSQRFKCLL